MKAPGGTGARDFDATPDILTYLEGVCPNADECFTKWIPVAGREDGAECGWCYQWLGREALNAQLFGWLI